MPHQIGLLIPTQTEPTTEPITTGRMTTNKGLTFEKPIINEAGKRISGGCCDGFRKGLNVIPGLDADFCKTCRIWWFDARYRVPPKRRKAQT
jgi:hypothetical protein